LPGELLGDSLDRNGRRWGWRPTSRHTNVCVTSPGGHVCLVRIMKTTLSRIPCSPSHPQRHRAVWWARRCRDGHGYAVCLSGSMRARASIG
jgi:hypothetical protein